MQSYDIFWQSIDGSDRRQLFVARILSNCTESSIFAAFQKFRNRYKIDFTTYSEDCVPCINMLQPVQIGEYRG